MCSCVTLANSHNLSESYLHRKVFQITKRGTTENFLLLQQVGAVFLELFPNTMLDIQKRGPPWTQTQWDGSGRGPPGQTDIWVWRRVRNSQWAPLSVQAYAG